MVSQEISVNEKGLTEAENLSEKLVIGPNMLPQKSFTHYVIQMALDQIEALSDCLIAIQASKYEVEKNTITSLAFLIREKTENIKKFFEEMVKEKRPIALGEPFFHEIGESHSSMCEPEKKNLLFTAIIRWYEKEAKKTAT